MRERWCGAPISAAARCSAVAIIVSEVGCCESFSAFSLLLADSHTMHCHVPKGGAPYACPFPSGQLLRQSGCLRRQEFSHVGFKASKDVTLVGLLLKTSHPRQKCIDRGMEKRKVIAPVRLAPVPALCCQCFIRISCLSPCTPLYATLVNLRYQGSR